MGQKAKPSFNNLLSGTPVMSSTTVTKVDTTGKIKEFEPTQVNCKVGYSQYEKAASEFTAAVKTEATTGSHAKNYTVVPT